MLDFQALKLPYDQIVTRLKIRSYKKFDAVPQSTGGQNLFETFTLTIKNNNYSSCLC